MGAGVEGGGWDACAQSVKLLRESVKQPWQQIPVTSMTRIFTDRRGCSASCHTSYSRPVSLAPQAVLLRGSFAPSLALATARQHYLPLPHPFWSWRGTARAPPALLPTAYPAGASGVYSRTSAQSLQGCARAQRLSFCPRAALPRPFPRLGSVPSGVAACVSSSGLRQPACRSRATPQPPRRCCSGIPGRFGVSLWCCCTSAHRTTRVPTPETETACRRRRRWPLPPHQQQGQAVAPQHWRPARLCQRAASQNGCGAWRGGLSS